MPAYVLVKAEDGWTQDDPMVYQTGYPVQVMPTNQYGGKQILPKFVQFVITDGTVSQIRAYCDEWRREIDWEFVSHDYAVDGHRLSVFTKPTLVSASGMNGLTRDKVEAFLNNWNAAVVSISANSVVFDAAVSDAIASNGFWSRDVSPFIFIEKSYVQVTGIHETEINYSGSGLTAEQVASAIVQRGCTVTANKPSRMTFACGRDTVFNVFKLDVLQKTQGSFARRKWAFTQEAIDAAALAGGSLALTRQQALAFLHNRLLD